MQAGDLVDFLHSLFSPLRNKQTFNSLLAKKLDITKVQALSGTLVSGWFQPAPASQTTKRIQQTVKSPWLCPNCVEANGWKWKVRAKSVTILPPQDLWTHKGCNKMVHFHSRHLKNKEREWAVESSAVEVSEKGFPTSWCSCSRVIPCPEVWTQP